MASPPLRYNPNTTLPLPHPYYHSELVQSLAKIVRGAPPCKPWKDPFKSKSIGFWTGPTSIAYLFLWLSQTYKNLSILGKSAHEWCASYIDCGQENTALESRGRDELGVKNEYLAFSAVKASHLAANGEVEKALTYVNRLVFGATILNQKASPQANELLSGRAGALVLLRVVKKFVPGAVEKTEGIISELCDKILSNDTPWIFGGKEYLGAGHGRVGILTQLILSEPHRNQKRIEEKFNKLLDLQQENGAWPVIPNRDIGLVQFCHGSPGFVISFEAIQPYCSPELQQRLESSIQSSIRDIIDHGYLKKEPNLCHGVLGNALALKDEPQEQFMAYATAERVEEGLANGTYEKGDDAFGMQWGEAGRAWAWMVMDLRKKGEKQIGFAGYTDV
ncbi:MAG: hypothetical protein Q9160_002997 [Pyrenula sp. 1 TL-2023]